MSANNSNFYQRSDALAEQVNFEGFSRSKLDIFPVHFERELKLNNKLQNCSLPSDSQLEATLQSGHEAYRALERFTETQFGSAGEEEEESLARVGEMASQVERGCEELRGKQQSEFSCWLQAPHLSAGTSQGGQEGPILGTEDTLQAVERYLTSCVLIAQSTDRALELGHTQIKEFNSSSHEVLAGLDNLTIADHNLSRAPAAS